MLLIMEGPNFCASSNISCDTSSRSKTQCQRQCKQKRWEQQRPTH